jgi:hypothetical protein
VETRHLVTAMTDLYKLEPAIIAQIAALEGGSG